MNRLKAATKCRTCGKPFKPTGNRQLFCTAACRPQKARSSHYDAEYHRARERASKHPCVDCGVPVSRKSTRCHRCAAGGRRKPYSGPDCVACESRMRLVLWRGGVFYRCPSCGLEISQAGPYVEAA